MKTSYFGNLKNIKNPVAITAKPPAFFKGPNYIKLAPKSSFLWAYKNGEIDEEEYVKQYMKLVLKPLSPQETYDDIVNTYGNDVVLLCYEKPTDFCHRHIVASWFEINLGVKVTELLTNRQN